MGNTDSSSSNNNNNNNNNQHQRIPQTIKNHFNPSLQDTLLTPLSQSKFKFQLLSDIHLEFRVPAIFPPKQQNGDENEICDGIRAEKKRGPITDYFKFEDHEIVAENLILAGDIGLLSDEGKQYDALEEFLVYCCSIFKRVFIVQGNHHYYHAGTIEEGDAKMRSLAANKNKIVNQNLIFLNKDIYDVAGTDIRILGCTLWSEITEAGKIGLNDFRTIKELSYEKFSQMHRDHAAWLANESKKAEAEGKRVLILTHHAPCHDRGVTPQENYEWEQKYGICGSDMIPSLFSKEKTPAVKMWVFGHTHWTCFFECGGICVVANQVGYPNESLFKGFGTYVAPVTSRVYGF